jgi:hypothetical protein
VRPANHQDTEAAGRWPRRLPSDDITRGYLEAPQAQADAQVPF